jgi:hypothetical protein
VGEYAFAVAEGFALGEFSAGDAVAVRFEEDKMDVWNAWTARNSKAGS